MKLTIEIDTDNDAFHEDPEQVRHLLDRVSDQVETGVRGAGNLMDSNGNTVGTWRHR